MRSPRRLAIAAFLGAALLHTASPSPAAQDAAKTWSNVMYLGGAAGVRGKALNWDNRLTISKDTIAFTGKNKIRLDIETSSVRALEYTGHTHMNDDAAAAGLVAGGLIGMLAGSAFRSTDHYLLVQYELTDGMMAAVLFRLHKENQQAIIAAMHAATGLPAAR